MLPSAPSVNFDDTLISLIGGQDMFHLLEITEDSTSFQLPSILNFKQLRMNLFFLPI